VPSESIRDFVEKNNSEKELAKITVGRKSGESKT
jgi:hypothetical protein